MMIQEINMLLTREGLPNSMFHVEDVGGSDAHPVHKADITLACSACPDQQWKAATFEPCPHCGQRATVRKVAKDEITEKAPPPPKTRERPRVYAR
jgi:hypothetical protein